MLKRKDLVPTDLIYWCPTNYYGADHAWYGWGGPEYRECGYKNQQDNLHIFCCIKDGLFHYVED